MVTSQRTFYDFEDINAWQSARHVTAAIYAVSNRERFGRDYALRDQVRRAAISIMANIAEGSTYRSDRDFARFLFTAKGSAVEVQSHLYVARDQGYIYEDEFKDLYSKAQVCCKQLARLISYLRKKEGKPKKDMGGAE